MAADKKAGKTSGKQADTGAGSSRAAKADKRNVDDQSKKIPASDDENVKDTVRLSSDEISALLKSQGVDLKDQKTELFDSNEGSDESSAEDDAVDD